jgi:hypothetical protein
MGLASREGEMLWAGQGTDFHKSPEQIAAGDANMFKVGTSSLLCAPVHT